MRKQVFTGAFTTLFCTFLLMPPLSMAQNNNIEIHLDALDHYVPPPMFEAEQSLPSQLDTSSSFSMNERANSSAKRTFAPLPTKKPTYVQKSGFNTSSMEPQLDKSQLVLQNAQDILEKIDSSSLSDRQKENIEAQADGRIEKKTLKSQIREEATLTNQEEFEIVLPFRYGEDVLSEDQKKIILQQILLRLQKYNDSRLKIYSYAADSSPQQSAARRLSLKRAMAIRDFLIAKNIPETSIFLFPLGNINIQDSDFARLVVSRI